MLFRAVVALFGSDWNLKRLCGETRQPHLRKVLIKLYGMYQYENGSSIAWDSQFAGPACFPHGIKSIFISGGAKIGRNCVIFQQVTIGSNTMPGSRGRGSPEIGDNCYIGAGAKIVGAVKIGNNVRIGANTVVSRDVPDNCVVLSGDQKIIEREAVMDNRFYSNRNGWQYYEDGRWYRVSDPKVLAGLTSD